MNAAALVSLVAPGRADALARRPPGTQRDAPLEPTDGRTFAAALRRVRLPVVLREMYTALSSVCNEFYLGDITLRSLSAQACDDSPFAVSYGTATEPACYHYDAIDGLVLRRRGDAVEWIATVDDFLALAMAAHRQRADAAEQAYAAKCVNGRHVLTPELHPDRSDEQTTMPCD